MKYKLSNDNIQRYKDFLSSEAYLDLNEIAKSEYWKHHSSLVKINISNNIVEISGKSGFYTSHDSSLKKFKNFIVSLLRSALKILISFKNIFGATHNPIKLLNYFDAYEKLFTSDEIGDPGLSPYKIDFNEIRKRNKFISSVKGCRKNYEGFTKGKFLFSEHVQLAYYHLNILNKFAEIEKWSESKTILEIGGGNGNLISLIKNHVNTKTTIIDIDLPETISHAFLYLSSLFPQARILLPSEIKSNDNSNINLEDYDFIFLTPNQTWLLQDNTVDLAINIHSFQEMTHEQIHEYFSLIQRVGKDNSFFLTSNRVEKIPSGETVNENKYFPPVNRFFEYPWDNKNQVIIFEICRFLRLTQLDPTFIRLEKIRKS
tara:strand:- start:651 stop:1769 length:1119 start_codon:yes stop_codon:yes gene_type:complete